MYDYDSVVSTTCIHKHLTLSCTYVCDNPFSGLGCVLRYTHSWPAADTADRLLFPGTPGTLMLATSERHCMVDTAYARGSGLYMLEPREDSHIRCARP